MSNGTILLVDDDVDMCAGLEDIIQDKGYSAFSASTCAEGLKIAREKKPQAAFLDIRLPDGSGTTLLTDLKKVVPDCVCIILTAHADVDSAVAAMEKGAFRYLTKPVNPSEILQLLELVFEMVRLREEKKLSDKALRKSEEQYRRLVETMNDGMGVLDVNGNLIYVNRRFYEMLGYAEEEMLNRHVTDFLDDTNKGILINELEKRESGVAGIYELEWTKRDGSRIVTIISPQPLLDEEGKYTGSFAVITDITERIKAEKALRQSEEKFSKAFSSSPTLITISTLKEGRFIEVNDAFLDAIGFSREEVIGRTSIELNMWADKDFCDKTVNLLSTQGAISNEEMCFCIKDGKALDVLYSAETIDIEGEKCMLAVMIDVTERKKLERQLIQSQKMEAVGQLTGGIAHDFNNILSAIVGYGHLLKLKVKDDEILQGLVEQILSSSKRAANLIQGLLSFSRKQLVTAIPADLDTIVTGVNKLLSRLLREDIDLKIILNTPSGNKNLTVLADPVQIEQALMNLTTNARDAMPEGGSLIIETCQVQIDENFIKKHGFGTPGTYASVTVTDTGEGMDSNTIEKIFEPFFTTKTKDKGTGLGLAMVYGIVKQHNGFISVDSEVNKGTMFRIYLPLTESKVPEPALKKQKSDSAPLRGSETVLLAEDDFNLRVLVKTILVKYGYKVIEASDGQEAIDKYMENKDSIQLLISDLLMPKKSGNDVYDEIRKVTPDIRAIILSGYDDDMLHKKKILQKDITFIQKPVQPNDLLQKIREELEK